MQVVSFTTYPGAGGAGIAALRLVEALSFCIGQQVLFGSLDTATCKTSKVRRLVYRHSLMDALWRRFRAIQCRRDQLRIRQSSQIASSGFFSDRSPHGRSVLSEIRYADLVHFHWVNDILDYGYVLKRLPLSVPLIWTLHDMSPFTGGCCYAFECSSFQRACGNCPQLASNHSGDLSAKSLKRRLHAIRYVYGRLQLIAPSAWMARMAASSRLFAGVPCAVIPNAVDLGCFQPRDRDRVRNQLGIEPETALLLFVAASLSNPVKGMSILLAALPQLIATSSVPVQVVCIGTVPEHLPDGVRSLGPIADSQQLAGLYAAADLLVVPSLMDNAPNVIAEAHACGLPVLASAVGGIPEMIEPGHTGALVPPADCDALALAILELLLVVMMDRMAWSARCRATAERRYAPERVAQQHLDLYHHALERMGESRSMHVA